MVPTSLVLGEWQLLGMYPSCGSHYIVLAFARLHPACASCSDLLIVAMQDSGTGTFLIDGFPRKLDQLEEFEQKVCRCSWELGENGDLRLHKEQVQTSPQPSSSVPCLRSSPVTVC